VPKVRSHSRRLCRFEVLVVLAVDLRGRFQQSALAVGVSNQLLPVRRVTFDYGTSLADASAQLLARCYNEELSGSAAVQI